MVLICQGVLLKITLNNEKQHLAIPKPQNGLVVVKSLSVMSDSL